MTIYPDESEIVSSTVTLSILDDDPEATEAFTLDFAVPRFESEGGEGIPVAPTPGDEGILGSIFDDLPLYPILITTGAVEVTIPGELPGVWYTDATLDLVRLR